MQAGNTQSTAQGPTVTSVDLPAKRPFGVNLTLHLEVSQCYIQLPGLLVCPKIHSN